MDLYGGVDLHGNNGVYVISDEKDKLVFKKRLPNRLDVVLEALHPYKDDLANGIAVESTFNWYWLVDGLMADGFHVHLANPAAIGQYDGLKLANDDTDAAFLAKLLRLGILPTGHIYPPEYRSVRDLLRRRMLFVRHRTAQILSYKSLIWRQTGSTVTAAEIKSKNATLSDSLLCDSSLSIMGEANLSSVHFLKTIIEKMEDEARSRVNLRPEYHGLRSVPGIGDILSMVIMLETGDIGRFVGVSNYTSYCRGVGARCTSNGKNKGKNNRKNGNKYLDWAYVEAANHAKCFCKEAKSWHQRKASRKNTVLATKALASKLSKACYFIMRENVEFDIGRCFG